MAVLMNFGLSIFTYFANFFIARLGVRYGIRLALLAFWIAAVVTLTATINGLLSGLTSEIPPIVQTAISILPPNTGSCIAAIAACRAACWVYVSSVYAASVKARV